MKDILVASSREKQLDFWLNVIDISTDFNAHAKVLTKGTKINIENRPQINGQFLMVMFITGDEELERMELKKILEQIRKLSVENLVVINRNLARQLSLTTNELNEIGVRAIVDENMPMIYIANILHMVLAGGYYIEPIS